MFDIENITIQAGRPWTANEGNAGRDVCVIGTDLVENLFDNRSPEEIVGQEIRVGGVPYKILGVASPVSERCSVSRGTILFTSHFSRARECSALMIR
jgi:hypothetical protein